MRGPLPVGALLSSVNETVSDVAVPQALILTAIVISFGVLAFLLVLVKRVYQTVGTDDSDEMGGSEQ